MQHSYKVTQTGAGMTLRYCDSCGITHLLQMDDDGTYGWVEAYNPPVVECVEGSKKPAVAPVSFGGNKSSNPNLCYCAACNGMKSHYPGANRCFCAVCDGKKVHKG